MKALIKNQTVTIDNHGHSEQADINDSKFDLHLDKRTNTKVKGKTVSVRIKIPLNKDSDIQIYNNRKKSDIKDIPRTIRDEVQNALQDKDKREAFVREIKVILKTVFSDLKESDIKDVFTRLFRAFDIEIDDTKILELYKTSKSRLTYHCIVIEDDFIYEASINSRRISISGNEKLVNR